MSQSSCHLLLSSNLLWIKPVSLWTARMNSISPVDNKVGSNNLLLTTKYKSTASSSSSVQVQSASSLGNLSNDVTLSGVTTSNPVIDNSHFFSDESPDEDEDIFNDWVKTLPRPSNNVIYGPTLPMPHRLLHIKIDTLIAKLRVDPGVTTVHVPSKRSRSSLKTGDGQGRAKKAQNKLGSTKEKVTLYSTSTPMVGVPSFRQTENLIK